MCDHPYRTEIDNNGHFTYPCCHNSNVVICKTRKEDFAEEKKHEEQLAEAETPVWCYYEAVARAKAEQPGFDPDKQREILWPGKTKWAKQRRKTWTKGF